MIRKLRWKIIFINMSLVFLVLLIVFLTLFFSSYREQERMSYSALSHTLERYTSDSPEDNPRFEFGAPDKPANNKGKSQRSNDPLMLPTFVVSLSKEDHSFKSLFSPNLVVDQQTALQAAQEATAQSKSRGTLSDLHLRYSILEQDDVVLVALADRSSEITSMKNLILISILVGSAGLLAFFFISLCFSAWVVRPVDQAWKRQKQFVADASHELKTPLTVILANLNILSAHKESTIKEEWKWIQNTQSESNRMKKLVDDLLFLAKMDAQQTTLPIKLNLSDIVWSSLLPFESIAYEQGLSLNNEIDSDIYMMGTENQLRQLTMILLDNACKYSNPHGTVTLTLHPAGDKAQLSVHNTGEAIPEEHLSHLFERFYRSDAARVHLAGGYGLGLSIADSIVQAHHGKISVKSDPESGTVFTVTLPVIKQ